MAKIYMMNALAKALMQVQKEHPLDEEKKEFLKSDISELLKIIEKTVEEDLEQLAITLSFREQTALANYFVQTKTSDFKIMKLLRYSMSEKLYSVLFHAWENHPLHRELLELLGECDLESFHSVNLPIPTGILESWSKKFDNLELYFTTIGRYVMQVQVNTKEPDFSQHFEQMGFALGTPLYYYSFLGYMGHCDEEQFLIRDFPEQMKKVLASTTVVSLKKRMMINFLEKMAHEKETLPRFRSCFDDFFNIWKLPSEDNPLKKESPVAYKTYQWWYNYRTLVEGFAADSDRKRISFWKHYLSECSVERLKTARFLIMRFENYVIVESEKIGTLYFYEKIYFDQVVYPYLQEKRNGSTCRSWMKNKSKFEYSKMHVVNWENDVLKHLRDFKIV